MEAIIKVAAAEFTEELFKKISDLLKGRDAEITIAVNDNFSSVLDTETADMFWNRLEKSVTEIENGNGKNFTMSELDAFIKE